MATYEERRAAKADRFRGYADSAAASADAQRRRADNLSRRFEGGQPILVGHHSEKGARRDQAKMWDAWTMMKGLGDAAMGAEAAEISPADMKAMVSEKLEHYKSGETKSKSCVCRIGSMGYKSILQGWRKSAPF